MDLLTRAFRAEPVAVLTLALLIVQGLIETASDAGLSWESAARAVVTVLLGLVARNSVYAPDTVADLLGDAWEDWGDA